MELRPQTDEPRPSPAQDPTRGAASPEGSAPAVAGRPVDLGNLLARTWSVFKCNG